MPQPIKNRFIQRVIQSGWAGKTVESIGRRTTRKLEFLWAKQFEGYGQNFPLVTPHSIVSFKTNRKLRTRRTENWGNYFESYKKIFSDLLAEKTNVKYKLKPNVLAEVGVLQKKYSTQHVFLENLIKEKKFTLARRFMLTNVPLSSRFYKEKDLIKFLYKGRWNNTPDFEKRLDLIKGMNVTREAKNKLVLGLYKNKKYQMPNTNWAEKLGSSLSSVIGQKMFSYSALDRLIVATEKKSMVHKLEQISFSGNEIEKQIVARTAEVPKQIKEINNSANIIEKVEQTKRIININRKTINNKFPNTLVIKSPKETLKDLSQTNMTNPIVYDGKKIEKSIHTPSFKETSKSMGDFFNNVGQDDLLALGAVAVMGGGFTLHRRRQDFSTRNVW